MENVMNQFWQFEGFSIENVNISFRKELENPQDYFEFYPEYSKNIQVQLYQEDDIVQLHMVVDVNMQKDANETIQDYILTVTRDMPLKEFIWKYEGAEIVEKGED